MIFGPIMTVQFVAYYFKAGQVVAVARYIHFLVTELEYAINHNGIYSMQADPLVIKCSELMRLGLMPSAQEIKNGVVSGICYR